MTSSHEPTSEKPWLEVVGSRYFLDWLAEQNTSLAFSTYQTGKVFFLGRKPNAEGLSVFERNYSHCMGMWASPDASTITMATRYQLWRLQNVLAGVLAQNEFDALYVPRVAHTTGHLDIHDVAVDESGRVVFANTMFSCLATLSEHASFSPLWRPNFITKLAPEDRCHLNGLAMQDGRPRYVSVVAKTDVPEGWRDHRVGGGCILDLLSGETVASGLSMPHSPRFHDGRLWVLNSGCGEIGFIDLQSGKFESVAFCPGYLRGMTMVGDFAVVTLSLPRHRSFEGLPLDESLSSKNAEPQCGLYVIDTRTGQVAHTVRIHGMVTELYDVVALPGIVRPMALGFKTTEIERMIQIGAPTEL